MSNSVGLSSGLHVIKSLYCVSILFILIIIEITDMTTLLNILLLVSGIVFAATVMLMSPKGGLGLSLGGMNSTNEYGSKKSLEHYIKRVAYVAGLVFVVVCVLYPYLHG